MGKPTLEKIGKRLCGLISLDFCCNIQIAGSELDGKDIGWKRHESMHQFYFVSTVQAEVRGSIPTERCLTGAPVGFESNF